LAREAELALRFFRPQSGDLVATLVATMPTTWLAHRSLRRRKRDKLDVITVRIEGLETSEERFLSAHIGKERD